MPGSAPFTSGILNEENIDHHQTPVRSEKAEPDRSDGVPRRADGQPYDAFRKPLG